MNLLKIFKNIHVVTTSFTLRAIFTSQLILYKTLLTCSKAEYFLYRMVLRNRAYNLDLQGYSNGFLKIKGKETQTTVTYNDQR